MVTGVLALHVMRADLNVLNAQVQIKMSLVDVQK